VKPIRHIVCDFDGVLTIEDKYPFIEELNMEAIEVLREFQILGGKVALCTAREGFELLCAIQALGAVGFKPDAVNENLPERIKKFNMDCRKITGDIIIDDLSIDYTGDWKEYRRILIDDNPYFSMPMVNKK
jgi:hypothetical protein